MAGGLWLVYSWSPASHSVCRFCEILCDSNVRAPLNPVLLVLVVLLVVAVSLVLAVLLFLVVLLVGKTNEGPASSGVSFGWSCARYN